LDYELATAYAVRDEVLVGKLPLRVDILLIRRESGQLPETSRRDLAVLLPLLNRFTLIEFKGPTDTLEPGDLAQLVGCAFLWHSQQTERVPQADMSLIVLAPSVNEAVRDELHCLGWQIYGRGVCDATRRDALSDRVGGGTANGGLGDHSCGETIARVASGRAIARAVAGRCASTLYARGICRWAK
jgi:hypothetical protein